MDGGREDASNEGAFGGEVGLEVGEFFEGLPFVLGFGEVAFGGPGVLDGLVAEFGADEGEGAVDGCEVALGLLFKEFELFFGDGNAGSLESHFNNAGAEGEGFDAQADEGHELAFVESGRSRGKVFVAFLAVVHGEAEAKGTDGFAAFGKAIEDVFDEGTQGVLEAIEIRLGIVEEFLLTNGFAQGTGVDGGPIFVLGEAVKLVGSRAEAFANTGGREVDESADGADAEFVEFLAECGFEFESVDRDLAGVVTFFFGVSEAEVLAGGFGTGIGSEAGPADGDDAFEFLFGESLADLFGPVLEGREDVLEAGGVEPEDAGFVGGGFDEGAEMFEPAGELDDFMGDLAFGDDAGVEFAGEGESGCVAHAGEDAVAAGAFVGPEDQSLGFVLVDNDGGFRAPVGVASEEELERQGREVNTGPLVHDRGPVFPSRVRVVCL